MFDLVRIDMHEEGNVPDLRARDGSFYVECKASSIKSSSGGVIKGKQLVRFLEEINQRRFYAFAYHPICDRMKDNYPTARRLRNELSRTSNQVQYFTFPFSILCAFYQLKPHRYKDKARKGNEGKQPFTTMSYREAQMIFSLDTEFFRALRLNPDEYKPNQFHERVHILTRQGNLEDKLKENFHPEEV